MIEKMKAVCVVSEYSQKEKLLGALSDMGVLHVAEKKAAEFAVLERFSELSRIISELKAYSSEGEEAAELLSDKQFEEIYKATLAALDKKAALTAKTSELKLEIEKLRPWGEFDTSAIRSLPADLDFHFYRLDKKAYNVPTERPRYIQDIAPTRYTVAVHKYCKNSIFAYSKC